MNSLELCDLTFDSTFETTSTGPTCISPLRIAGCLFNQQIWEYLLAKIPLELQVQLYRITH